MHNVARTLILSRDYGYLYFYFKVKMNHSNSLQVWCSSNKLRDWSIFCCIPKDISKLLWLQDQIFRFQEILKLILPTLDVITMANGTGITHFCHLYNDKAIETLRSPEPLSYFWDWVYSNGYCASILYQCFISLSSSLPSPTFTRMYQVCFLPTFPTTRWNTRNMSVFWEASPLSGLWSLYSCALYLFKCSFKHDCVPRVELSACLLLLWMN